MADKKPIKDPPLVEPVRGRCNCGAIRFEFEGAPNWTLYCHCESCRRATSSPVTVWLSIPRESFRMRSGEMKNFPSSLGTKRGFCGVCGSPLSYESERIPDEIHIFAATLDDPDDVRPERHVFVAEQLPWFEVADHLPRFVSSSRGAPKPIGLGPIPR